MTKRIRRRSKDRGLPTRFFKPLDPQEFKFGLDLATAAASQRMPMDNPADYPVDVEDFGVVRFTDNPMNRATLAITHHYKTLGLPDEERLARSICLSFRIDAMGRALKSPRAAPWVGDEGPCIGVHDAVLCAAARAKLSQIGDDVEFESDQFWDLVEQIAAEQRP